MAPLPVQYVPNSEIVLLQYSDLVSDTADLSLSIEAAYGPDGLGILAVRGVPDLAPQRARLLKLGDEFAKLPREVKAKYEHPSSHYQFGWSHGKESFNGQPDFSKGSYYNNPLYDRPVDDEKAIAEHPSFAHPNIWPSEEDFPGLRDAFMTLGHTVVSVGKLIARHCDKFVHSRVPAYPAKRLETVIETSRCCKGRLLHYFPQVTEEPAADAAATAELPSADEMGSWCGWHNDHGSLTGLVPAMYHNAAGEEVPSPDPTGGLYIRARSGRVVRAALPKDCLGFQVGETQQVHSGGVLQATPHCVRGAQRGVGVARNTFAVFMEPMWTDGMANPEGTTREATTYGSSSRFLPKGVPELEKRWDPTDDFGRFTDRTLEAYAYEGEESM